jgi:hypothetical protein
MILLVIVFHIYESVLQDAKFFPCPHHPNISDLIELPTELDSSSENRRLGAGSIRAGWFPCEGVTITWTGRTALEGPTWRVVPLAKQK